MQGRQVPLDVFVGRAAERARVAEVVAQVEAGQPWLVGIEGEPGAGKTSLARRCLAEAPGLRVLWVRAVVAEADLDFGLVDQLLRTAGDVSRPVFPAAGNGSPASSFAVGAHVLDVVGELASDGPVAIVVDDLQTADRQSPVHMARLLLAHGRLLRRTGQRRPAVDRLRRPNDFYLALRAAPFLARTEQELAACDLPATRAKKQSVLTLTSRETEVAHLAGRGLSNPEIAAELFISRKAVEYHLGNIYAKCGLRGRRELRRFVEQWRQPAGI